MLQELLIFTIFNVFVTPGRSEYYTAVKSKLDEVVYMYPNQIKDDSKLDPCSENSVCSIVNKRYWLPPLVYRLCRCTDGSNCPFDQPSNSVGLDNRSQLKVCSKIESFSPCTPSSVGLSIRENKLLGGMKGKEIKLWCQCKWPAYWKLSMMQNNATVSYSEYVCSKLGKCQSGEFCGHIRKDTYSTYHHCSCPPQHICLNKDRTSNNASELLYYGPMLRAYCTIPNFHMTTTEPPTSTTND